MRMAGSGTARHHLRGRGADGYPAQPYDESSQSLGPLNVSLARAILTFTWPKAGYTFETLTGVQGHGTLAQQDANAVAITGGSVTGIDRPDA